MQMTQPCLAIHCDHRLLLGRLLADNGLHQPELLVEGVAEPEKMLDEGLGLHGLILYKAITNELPVKHMRKLLEQNANVRR